MPAWVRLAGLLTRPVAVPPRAESFLPDTDRLFDLFGVRASVENAGFVRATGDTV